MEWAPCRACRIESRRRGSKAFIISTELETRRGSRSNEAWANTCSIKARPAKVVSSERQRVWPSSRASANRRGRPNVGGHVFEGFVRCRN